MRRPIPCPDERIPCAWTIPLRRASCRSSTKRPACALRQSADSGMRRRQTSRGTALAAHIRGHYVMLLGLIIRCGLLSIVYGVYTITSVMSADAGSQRMQEISGAVREGAQAYVKRQSTTIAGVGVVVFIGLGLLLSWTVAVGFAIGAILSGAAGFIGMNVSVRANVRTAQAATKSLAGGLDIAFRSGAVTGLLVAGLPLLGGSGYFGFLTGVLGYGPSDRTVVDALVPLGFGASLFPLFARLGGRL